MSHRNYWDRYARKYDASLRWLLGKPIPGLLELASEAVRGKRRVLEVAAGTGVVTAAIARSGNSVVATDYAVGMVDVLTERIGNLGLSNVTCEHADIYALPYAEGEFDAVVAANVLHLVPDLPAALAALRRVLEPGGIVVVPTFCHDETRVSGMVSRLLAIGGFPGQRRFTVKSLNAALEDNGVLVSRSETLDGLIPIGYVDGVFESSKTSRSS
ncbi:MAG TPA: class I SAM-dependent methyltransferase [Woeseiaceae bacterium]|nr:class I SAM-dependent methyltransferase [Woeseiaceae bacterium]